MLWATILIKDTSFYFLNAFIKALLLMRTKIYLMVFNKMAIARLRRLSGFRRLRDPKLHNAGRNYQKKEDLQNHEI